MAHKEYPGEAVDAIATWVSQKRKEKQNEEQKK